MNTLKSIYWNHIFFNFLFVVRNFGDFCVLLESHDQTTRAATEYDISFSDADTKYRNTKLLIKRTVIKLYSYLKTESSKQNNNKIRTYKTEKTLQKQQRKKRGQHFALLHNETIKIHQNPIKLPLIVKILLK